MFLGFSGFGFRRKLVCTKTQQGIDKASKHNERTVLSRALLLRTHQQEWFQRAFFYHLYSSSPFVPAYPFSSFHQTRYWFRIRDRDHVPFPRGGHTIATAAAPASNTPWRCRFICHPFLSSRRRRSRCSEPTDVLPLRWYTIVSL